MTHSPTALALRGIGTAVPPSTMTQDEAAALAEAKEEVRGSIFDVKDAVENLAKQVEALRYTLLVKVDKTIREKMDEFGAMLERSLVAVARDARSQERQRRMPEVKASAFRRTFRWMFRRNRTE